MTDEEQVATLTNSFFIKFERLLSDSIVFSSPTSGISFILNYFILINKKRFFFYNINTGFSEGFSQDRAKVQYSSTVLLQPRDLVPCLFCCAFELPLKGGWLG